MTIQNVLASVAVKDLKKARAWYSQLLGRPAESTPMEGLAEWKFPHGGWLQVYEDRERAGGGSCTLAVDDLEPQAQVLRRMGIVAISHSGHAQVRTLMITDPDGNHLAFAQALDASLAA
ncbi:MAG: VOC family protein [Burkholderiaceae bacterium]|nr:VOC family protein [Burkholderiaceae bacterium]